MKKELIPLWELVQKRRHALGLGRRELVQRIGFSNTTHGLRALSQFWEGDLLEVDADWWVNAFSVALELPPERVGAVLHACRNKRLEQAREAFVPCGWLIGTASRPSQITIYALSGGAGRWLRIALDTNKPPLTYASQALAVARKTPEVKFFGPVTGFVVSYSYDVSVRFDLEGEPQAVMSGPYQPGMASVAISGRKISRMVG